MTMPQAAVTIIYCRQCNWMLRSTWMAQELLSTFAEEISSITLQPRTGGQFEIWVNTTRIWSRIDDGGFPDVKTLKQKVRDVIAPERDLGHLEQK